MTDPEKSAQLAALRTARADRLRHLHASADKGNFASTKLSADMLAEMDRRIADLDPNAPTPAPGRRVSVRG